MKLGKYISDLLYRYDLVIVPGFGGFIGRRKNAHYDRETYVFSPPHKEISFNAQLQENDGLLVKYLAEINRISYGEALRYVENQVYEWRSMLNNKNAVKLEQIGVFHQTDDEKIVFLPLTTTNYLTEAFGLSSFIHRPEKTKATLTGAIAQSPVKKKLPASVDKRKLNTKKSVPSNHNSNFWKYAAVLVIGLGILGAGVSRLYKPKEPQPVYQKATFVLQQDFPPVVIGQKTASELLKTETKPVNQYFIISGAFRNKNNAKRKKQELINAGFDADIIGQNKHKLWMVAYQGFVTENDARQKLAEIKKLQASAWLFHK
jgi:nucleoid DNA-binding protein